MSSPALVTDATDLYGRIQEFYAEQMHLLDAGATEEWAATFTHDGVFAANGLPAPAHGRAAIAAGARQSVEALARAGLVNRHWLGMLRLTPEPAGAVRARCYAMVIQTPRGGGSSIFRSTVCTDLLVPAGDSWLVRDRQITRDDLA